MVCHKAVFCHHCSLKTSRFIYAGDLALTFQALNFVEVECNLIMTLDTLCQYYETNSLKPNPPRIESCTVHFRNRQAGQAVIIL